ncbi:hypothetical protein DRQ25_18045, partial [Candidatus Fermentibacteria bacterium]
MDQPKGQQVWLPLFNEWHKLIMSGGQVHRCVDGAWVTLSNDDAGTFTHFRELYEKNPLQFFLPHGGGLDFINDWTNGICMLVALNRAGKDQPLDATVQTPLGPRNMGSLVVGDIVFGGDGKPCSVTEIRDMGEGPVYELTFDDSVTTECGPGHLWKYLRHHRAYLGKVCKKRKNGTYNQWEVLPLNEIIKLESKPNARGYIPRCGASEYSEKSVYIHPYIIGVLLGDG